MTRARDGAGLAALVTATAAWGSAVVTIKIAARGLPVQTITFIEVAAALVVLGGVLIARRGRSGPARPNRALLVAGVLEPGLSYPLINAGLARTSGTHAALIIGLESVLVVLLAAVVSRTRVSGRVAVALGLAVAGAALLTAGDGGTASPAGDLLVVAGVLAAAVYVIVVQRLAASFDPFVLTFYQFLFGGAAILPLAVVSLSGGPSRLIGHPSPLEVGAAIATGVLGSAVAFALYNWALRRVTVTLAGTSLTLIPVFGIALSATFLGESITVGTVVAAGAVVAGVALAAERTPPGGEDGAARAVERSSAAARA